MSCDLGFATNISTGPPALIVGLPEVNFDTIAIEDGKTAVVMRQRKVEDIALERDAGCDIAHG